MAPTPRQIGMTLKRIRRDRKLSQYALAKAAGVSREYVRKLETGGSDPTVGMLARLAKALGVAVTELLEE
jgi:transcriptional regulator with XRE-family HTH domain